MTDYEVIAETEAYEIGRRAGRLIAACRCGSGANVPDRGMGRAAIDAWATQHKGCSMDVVDLCPTCGLPAEVPGEGRFCGLCEDFEGHCRNDHCMSCGSDT